MLVKNLRLARLRRSRLSRATKMSENKRKNKKVVRKPQLTLGQRLRIIQEKEKGTQSKELADRYKVGVNHITRIWRLRNEYLALSERTQNNSLPNAANETTDRILYEWILRARYRMDVTDDTIRLVGQEVADYLHNEDFCPDNDWLERLKSRYNLENTPLTGLHSKTVDPANLKSLHVNALLQYIRENDPQISTMYANHLRRLKETMEKDPTKKGKDLAAIDKLLHVLEDASATRKKLVRLTLDQRINLIREKGNGVTINDLCKRYNISRPNIYRIWRRREEYLSRDINKLRKTSRAIFGRSINIILARHNGAQIKDLAKRFNLNRQAIYHILRKKEEYLSKSAIKLQPGTSSDKTKMKKAPVMLTLAQKVNVILEKDSGARVKDLCERYNVRRQLISRIWRRREEYLSRHADMQGYLNPASAAIEKIVYEWILRARYQTTVTNQKVQQAANDVAEFLKIKDFQSDRTWFKRLQLHYRIEDLQLTSLNRKPVDPANLKSLYVADIVDYIRQTDPDILIASEEYLKKHKTADGVVSDECIEEIFTDADGSDAITDLNQSDTDLNEEAIEIEDVTVKREDEIDMDPEQLDPDTEISVTPTKSSRWKVTSYMEAREALAAVEEFLLQKENIRAACLLNQLDVMLKEENAKDSY